MADPLQNLKDEVLLDFLRETGLLGDIADVRLRPQTPTYTSRFWRLEAQGREYVIKIYYPGLEQNPYYPTLPDHEAHALTELESEGLAPRLEAFTNGPTGAPLLIYGFAPSEDNEIHVSDVARLLGRLAKLPPPHAIARQVPAGAAAVLAHADSILDLIPASRRAVNLMRMRPVPPEKSDAAFSARLVHRSLSPGVLQATAKGPVLMDWQYAGLGDPVEDIAGFLSPGLSTLYGLRPLVLHAEDLFLKHYPHEDILERFLAQRAAYHWRIAAYCLFRSETLADTNAPAARAYAKALEEEVDLLLRIKS